MDAGRAGAESGGFGGHAQGDPFGLTPNPQGEGEPRVPRRERRRIQAQSADPGQLAAGRGNVGPARPAHRRLQARVTPAGMEAKTQAANQAQPEKPAAAAEAAR